jgi:hypothetical protein
MAQGWPDSFGGLTSAFIMNPSAKIPFLGHASSHEHIAHDFASAATA